MQNINMFVGLDVSKDEIEVATAEEGTPEVKPYGSIGGDLDSVDKLIRKLVSTGKTLHVVYEAGPCGYDIYRYLKKKKIDCTVCAPSMTPRPSGDRVKTDRRDALMLARLHRSGDLTPVFVPNEEDEAVRDLVRSRELTMIDHKRCRQRLLSLLLRNGIRYSGRTNWNHSHFDWLSRVSLPHPIQQIVFQEYLLAIQKTSDQLTRLDEQIRLAVESWRMGPVVKALQALRGISLVVASGLVAEIGDITRFTQPRQLMAYVGIVPSEYSSGRRRLQGGITKCGNTHARRLLVEASWSYQHKARVSEVIRRRQLNLPPNICELAWKAQTRLCRRFRRMVYRGINKKVVATAIGRELLGFVWAVAKQVPIQQPMN
jgi:transposase